MYTMLCLNSEQFQLLQRQYEFDASSILNEHCKSIIQRYWELSNIFGMYNLICNRAEVGYVTSSLPSVCLNSEQMHLWRRRYAWCTSRDWSRSHRALVEGAVAKPKGKNRSLKCNFYIWYQILTFWSTKF